MRERRDVARSKRLIKEAFFSLGLEKDVAAITVRDIIDRADISRGTFYVYYTDVPDLKEKMLNEYLDERFGDFYSADYISGNLEQMLSEGFSEIRKDENILYSVTHGGLDNYFFSQMEKRMSEALGKVYSGRESDEYYFGLCISSLYTGLCRQVITDRNHMIDTAKLRKKTAEFISRGA